MECPQDWEKIVDTLDRKGLSQEHILEITHYIRYEVPVRPWTL